MIKTLIVDDDIEMLQGLENIINWEDYGFSITGKAENGFEALNIISQALPDVIITDITMPVMDGLELIREAKKFKPDMKSIIISCHEEFNYAKEAIRLEADEYLLKHTLTEDELIRVITVLKNKIQKEREQQEGLLKANRELNINKYAIIDKFFTDIMENDIVSEKEICARAALSNIQLPERSYRLISLFADNIDEVLLKCPIQEYGLFKLSILNIIEETVNGKEGIRVFSYNRNAFALLYWDNTLEVPIQRTLYMIKAIQDNVQSVLKFKLSVCFSSVYKDIKDLKQAASETEALREAYFYKGSGEIITADKEYENKDTNDLYMEFGPELKGLLSLHKRAELMECIDRLSERIISGSFSPKSTRSLLRRLLVDMEAAFGKYEVNMEPFQLTGDTFIMLRRIMENALDYILEKLSQSRNMTSRPEIKKVIEYIEAHLDEETSLESMATYVNMNSNYFSRLFKSETGITFSDYLVNKRMELATELLMHSDYSIEEITKAIGIESLSYFYRLYKKMTGNTPGDVRNKASLT